MRLLPLACALALASNSLFVQAATQAIPYAGTANQYCRKAEISRRLKRCWTTNAAKSRAMASPLLNSKRPTTCNSRNSGAGWPPSTARRVRWPRTKCSRANYRKLLEVPAAYEVVTAAEAVQDPVHTAFGGRFTTMLNTELRIKSGLSRVQVVIGDVIKAYGPMTEMIIADPRFSPASSVTQRDIMPTFASMTSGTRFDANTTATVHSCCA